MGFTLYVWHAVNIENFDNLRDDASNFKPDGKHILEESILCQLLNKYIRDFIEGLEGGKGEEIINQLKRQRWIECEIKRMQPSLQVSTKLQSLEQEVMQTKAERELAIRANDALVCQLDANALFILSREHEIQAAELYAKAQKVEKGECTF